MHSLFKHCKTQHQNAIASAIPPYTPVIFSDESQGKGLALLRTLVSDMSTRQGMEYLRQIAPPWLTQCLFQVCGSWILSFFSCLRVVFFSIGLV